jgi:GNAT superfamily N-acetyltransferase
VTSAPPHPLLTLLHDAARGTFPPGDFTTTHFPSPESPADGVFAFFGHHVIATDVDRAFVRQWTDRDPFALSDVRFLAAFADKLGTTPGIYDAVYAAIGEGKTAVDVGLIETDDLTHPRVVRALSYRDPSTIRVFVDPTKSGLLVMGRGLAGRMEAAYEVDPDARGNGIGRTLIAGARQVAPTGEPVFLQVSPGNVWSMKSLGHDPAWKPVGAEILFLRTSASANVW